MEVCVKLASWITDNWTWTHQVLFTSSTLSYFIWFERAEHSLLFDLNIASLIVSWLRPELFLMTTQKPSPHVGIYRFLFVHDQAVFMRVNPAANFHPGRHQALFLFFFDQSRGRCFDLADNTACVMMFSWSGPSGGMAGQICWCCSEASISPLNAPDARHHCSAFKWSSSQLVTKFRRNIWWWNQFFSKKWDRGCDRRNAESHHSGRRWKFSAGSQRIGV